MAEQYVFHIEPTSIYTPEWGGNRKRPEAHQMRFHRRFLSASEQAELYRKSGESNFNEEIFCAETDRIENGMFDFGDGPIEISDARQLLTAQGKGLDKLVLEVQRAYRKEDSLDEKNS